MTTSAFKVLQVFSDRRGRTVTSKICNRLRQSSELSGSLAETSWNTELLRSPKLRLLAAREAAEANVVMIAAEEGEPLSAEVMEWLKLWRHRCRSGNAKLVALLRRETANAQPVVQEALHAFAIAAKMDFFCHSQVETASRTLFGAK